MCSPMAAASQATLDGPPALALSPAPPCAPKDKMNVAKTTTMTTMMRHNCNDNDDGNNDNGDNDDSDAMTCLFRPPASYGPSPFLSHPPLPPSTHCLFPQHSPPLSLRVTPSPHTLLPRHHCSLYGLLLPVCLDRLSSEPIRVLPSNHSKPTTAKAR